MGRKLSIQLSKILVIILCWLVVGFLVTLYDHFLLSSELTGGYAGGNSFIKNLTFNLSAALMGSVLGGLWLVLYVNEKLREKPYGYTLLMVALSFFAIVAFIMMVLGMGFVRFETGRWPYIDSEATLAFHDNLTNPFHLKNLVVWGSVVMLTQVGLQVNDKFGQGLLRAFITGRYHKPKKEQRVFMFVDLIGSTTMAEQLGNENYYNLLKDFFADITNGIIYNRGKIYQYVGDEVVISWKCQANVVRHDFLNCYFDIRKEIKAREGYYRNRYGLVPDFKAAVHYGEVTVGEIGIIKRDLTFSGDVLNTAARILTFCRAYDRKLLVSEKLVQYVAMVNGSFEFIKMGEERLRGKAKMTKIYAVFEKPSGDGPK